MGRMLTFMARVMKDSLVPLERINGVGVSQSTAILLNHTTGIGQLVGYEFAYFCEAMSMPEVCEPETPLTYKNINCTRLSAISGDSFNFSKVDRRLVTNRYENHTVLTYQNSILTGNFTNYSNRYANSAIKYILHYKWIPEDCFVNSYPGCNSYDPFWAENFVIDSFSPKIAHGKFPQSCTEVSFDESKTFLQTNKSTLVKYWPNIYKSVDSSTYDSVWANEWRIHGTCSTLFQDEYFSSSVYLIESLGTPSEFRNSGMEI